MPERKVYVCACGCGRTMPRGTWDGMHGPGAPVGEGDKP